MGEVLTSAQCSVCGKRRLASVATCPHCGAVEKIERSALGGMAVSWVDAFPLEITKCPLCGSGDVVRVSKFVRNTKLGNADGALLRTLSAPSKPGFGVWQYLIIPLMAGIISALLSFGLAVGISAYYLAPQRGMKLPSWDITVCCIVPLVFFAVAPLGVRHFMMESWRKRDERCEDSDMERWSREMEVWERLYYCHNCDHTTDPLIGRSASRHGMRNLLDR